MSKKITLYASRSCPWAFRAHLTLAELGLDYEEVPIDLSKSREPWYLEVNPRGLVPSLKYGDEVITESAVVVNFLVDAFPSHLVPSPGNPEAALKRARINFFVDTFVSKVVPNLFGGIRGPDEAERAAKAQALVENIEKEIIPLLQNAGPYFGGSKEFTLAEALTASFIIILYNYTKPEAALLPAFVTDKLRENKVWQNWVDAIFKKETVATFDVAGSLARTKKKLAELRK